MLILAVLALVSFSMVASSYARVINDDGGPFAYMTVEGNDNVDVVSLTNHTVVASFATGDGPHGEALSKDRSNLYVANWYGNTVTVLNATTGVTIATIPVVSTPHSVTTSNDGKYVYVTCSGSNSVYVIDTATNTVATTISISADPRTIATNPSNGYVYVASTISNDITVIDPSTNTVITTIPANTMGGYSGTAWGITFNPSGSTAYVAMRNHNVTVINTATNTATGYINIPSAHGTTYVAVNAAGTKAYVSDIDNGNVYVIDMSDNSLLSTIKVGSGTYDLGIDPVGGLLYVANRYSNNVSVIDISSDTVVDTIDTGSVPSYIVFDAITTPTPGVYHPPVTIPNLYVPYDINPVRAVQTGTPTVMTAPRTDGTATPTATVTATPTSTPTPTIAPTNSPASTPTTVPSATPAATETPANGTSVYVYLALVAIVVIAGAAVYFLFFRKQ